jgi:hypothetical protein
MSLSTSAHVVVAHAGELVAASTALGLGLAWRSNTLKKSLRALILPVLVVCGVVVASSVPGAHEAEKVPSPRERLDALRKLTPDETILTERTRLAEELGRAVEASDDWLLHGYPERAAEVARRAGDHQRAGHALYLYGDLPGADAELRAWRTQAPDAASSYAEVSLAILRGDHVEAGRRLRSLIDPKTHEGVGCLVSVLTGDAEAGRVILRRSPHVLCMFLAEHFAPYVDEIASTTGGPSNDTRRQLPEVTRGLASIGYLETAASCGACTSLKPMPLEVLCGTRLTLPEAVLPLVARSTSRGRQLLGRALFLAMVGNPERALALIQESLPSYPLDPRLPGDAATLAKAYDLQRRLSDAREAERPLEVLLAQEKALQPAYEAALERERDLSDRYALVGLRAALRASLGQTQGVVEEVVASHSPWFKENTSWLPGYVSGLSEGSKDYLTSEVVEKCTIEHELAHVAQWKDTRAVVAHLRAHPENAGALAVLGHTLPQDPALLALSRFELTRREESTEPLLRSLASTGEHARVARALGDVETEKRAHERVRRIFGGHDEPQWNDETRVLLIGLKLLDW